MSIDTVSAANPAPAPAPQPAPIQSFNDSDGPSFSDVLDILNPLQHIPIINTIYQHLTGDSEGAVADVAGGTLWTGPIGLVTSLIDLAVRSDTGKSTSDNVLAWLGLDDDDNGTTALAQSENPTSAPAQAAQQTAAATAAPAIMPAMLPAAPAAPRSRNSDDGKDGGKDGAPQKGEYFVFAGGPTAASVVTPVTAPAPVQAAAYAAPQRQGQYLAFGGPAPSAPTPLTPAAPTAAPTAPAPAGLSPLPARSFAVPARRTQTAPNSLPQPTTGPAAIPGHGPSQAVGRSSDADWLLGAMSANLDKYQAAQKLTQSDSVASDGATLH